MIHSFDYPALAEYETSLRSAPARCDSYAGAARAAATAGDKPKAKTFHDQLLAMCGGSLTSRPATPVRAAE